MSRQPSILVIDDEPDVTSIVRDALALDGFNVFTAQDISKFDEISKNNEIDIFILDLILPQKNGLEIAKEIRRNSDAGIIILTGQSSEIDVVLGLEIGADDYIAKPFRTRELRARVASVYRRLKTAPAHDVAPPAASAPSAAPPREDEGIFRFNGWRLNTASRSLKRESGQKVELTTSEFDVLAYLVRNAGRVVTRNQIIDAIRGDDWAAYDRLVDGLVSRLRRKLADLDPDNEPIKTIRGVGYMFEPVD